MTAGTIAFGVRSTLGGTDEMSMMDALTDGVLRYLFSLGGIYLLAVVIDVLAPAFSAQANRVQALKVAAYGTTPYWIGGICALLPKLGLFGLVAGLYSFRLYAVGLPLVMKAPRDRARAYAAVVMVAAILVLLISAALTRAFV